MSTQGREDAGVRILAQANTHSDGNTNDTSTDSNTNTKYDHDYDNTAEHNTEGRTHDTPALAPMASDDRFVTSLATLPPELIDAILDAVPAAERRNVALALTRVLPHVNTASRHVWTHLAVRRGQQLVPTWRKLRENEAGAARVRTFAMESFRGDADILNNILRCLPQLRTLMLNMGTNFAPDHLAEMFEKPRPGIEHIELRFRPYVQKATYYQFLAGAYFDTAIEKMYRTWPETRSFTELSIVQDLQPRATPAPTRPHSSLPSVSNSFADLRLAARTPPPGPSTGDVSESSPSDTEAGGTDTPMTSASADSEDLNDNLEKKGYTRRGPMPYLSNKLQELVPKNFAQPIVFFDIKCLARLAVSPAAMHLEKLRLRVPSRDIAYILVSGAGAASTASGATAQHRILPALRYLDLSTTNLRLDAVLATLLRHLDRLEHLVLDRVNLFGFHARDRGDDLCRELGGMCVSAGLARGKEREKAIVAWDTAARKRAAIRAAEARRAAGTPENADGEQDQAEREEVARREEMERQIALARSRRGHRSAAQAPFSLRDRPSRRGTTTATVAAADMEPTDRAYFVLPPLPTLRSVCIGGEAQASMVNAATVQRWEDEFHAGWRDGLAKLLGWAVNVADKYERAVKKATEWIAADGDPRKNNNNAKGKGKKVVGSVRTRPPLDVRLYRFVTPSEPVPEWDPSDPTVGLVRVDIDEESQYELGRDQEEDETLPKGPRWYLDPYKQAIADAELYTHSHAIPPPCVLCTVPDCDGPSRRGAEPGERVDGRGGMGRAHKPGCGHEVGRRVWGWEGVDRVGDI